MTQTSAPATLVLLRLLAGRGARRARAALMAPLHLVSRWGAPAPERLLIAPQDIRTGDATIAADIYAGFFTFAGKIVDSRGVSPFALKPPSAEWARILYGFSWLRHLRAADSALARANARALVKEFIALLGQPSAHPAWRPDVVARRALSWLSQSPMLLENVEYEDYRRFIDVLVEGHKRLRRCLDVGLSGETQLLAATAMTSFALCSQGAAPQLKAASAALAEQLKLQVLPDGGPLSRNPQTLVDLLFELLPLRQAFAARGLPPPDDLLNAIDRMTPALRMFRHGDGSLALFNGMSVTAPDRVATLLAYQDSRSAALVSAPHAGYQRLAAGESLAIVDVGAPPPPLFSRNAHAGCLSFEYSLGRDRVVVNCGAPNRHRADLRATARLTAAHSTLTLDNTSSCIIAGRHGLERKFEGEILFGPTVACEREERPEEIAVTASHDGYLKRFGLRHERRLALSADGAVLRGRDRLIGAGDPPDIPYALRFHLHPRIAASALYNGRGALLVGAEGVLAFEAGGLPVSIEESIFFAAPEGPRPCAQLVIHGHASDIAEVSWSFRKQGGA
ncbi:putative heparinase superfamily protein [Rhodoblastus acidophilus]|nr:heparinase II/III family protein [Rhodoblastus acidophilus]MCW2274907.1 putative heparinase superfamily protein [Rhodoblastus acidophilus]